MRALPMLGAVLLLAACSTTTSGSDLDPGGGDLGTTDGHSGQDSGAIADGAGGRDAGAIADGGASGDGGDGGTQPVACGATWCRPGQTCSAGACAYACPSGALQVPGQFSSLYAASQTLVGKGGAICVTAAIGGPLQGLIYDRDLLVVGVSPDVAQVNVLSINDKNQQGRTQPAKVTLVGLGLSGLEILLHGEGDTIEVHASTVRGRVGGQPYAIGVFTDFGSTVLLDGLEVECIGGTPDCSAIEIIPSAGSGVLTTLRNSWLHDSQVGVSLADNYGGAVQIVNNTIVNAEAGINGNGRNQATIVNNLFVSCKGGQGGFTIAGVNHHNAYWQVQYNTLPPDPLKGDVTGDPKLDSNTPPGPGAGSSCLGTADPTIAIPVDYFGRVRGVQPDIGAVQAP